MVGPLLTLRLGIGAGLAGGFAEIAWIASYAAATPLRASDVARGVTETVLPGLGSSIIAPGLGLLIHMVLAVGVGIALASALRSSEGWRASGLSVLVVSIAALLAIWAVNFMAVLPVINPAFVSLLPYSVSALSKALFGLAVWATWHRALLSRKAAVRA